MIPFITFHNLISSSSPQTVWRRSRAFPSCWSWRTGRRPRISASSCPNTSRISWATCRCLTTPAGTADSTSPPACQTSLSSPTWALRCTMLMVSSMREKEKKILIRICFSVYAIKVIHTESLTLLCFCSSTFCYLNYIIESLKGIDCKLVEVPVKWMSPSLSLSSFI